MLKVSNSIVAKHDRDLLVVSVVSLQVLIPLGTTLDGC